MRWLHESWCVGRWHLIKPWSDNLGFSEVSAGFCRNRKILSFPLSEKDHSTLVHKLLSELLFLMRWNRKECLWQYSLLKRNPLALCMRAETLSSHHPTKFLMCRAVLARVGGAALGLPGLDSWMSLLSRSLLWCVTFSDPGTFSCLSALWNQYTPYLPRYRNELLEKVFWDTWQQEFSFSWRGHSSWPI